MVYGKHTRTWMNSLGAEWRNEVQLGYFNNLSTSFYQPLDVAQTLLRRAEAALDALMGGRLRRQRATGPLQVQ